LSRFRAIGTPIKPIPRNAIDGCVLMKNSN
jgi:hypothetical protein